MQGYTPKPEPKVVAPPPHDPSGLLDAVPAPVAAESLDYLVSILQARTQPGLADALEHALAYLQGLHAAQLIGAADAVRLSRLWSGAAADRLRDLPAPDAPKPVGLFGGQR